MKDLELQGIKNLACRILLDCGIQSVPVSLQCICRSFGIRLFSYQGAAALLTSRHMRERAQKKSAFSMQLGQELSILFDERLSYEQIRLAIAQELGQLLFKGKIPVSSVVKLPAGCQEGPAVLAQAFAMQLLAPEYVLLRRRLLEPETIASLCQIPLDAACVQAERLRQLSRRKQLRASFLERAVLEQLSSQLPEPGREKEQ